MKVSQRVKTNDKWNKSFKEEGIVGTVVRVVEVGPIFPNRNHFVLLDESEGNTKGAWFNPFDLEKIDE